MAGLFKQEFPPLLGLGFWPHTLDEIHRRCVFRFPDSITRLSVMDGLRQVVGTLNGFGFHLEVWVNGSFLTEKINPEDSDVAVRIQGEEFDAAPPMQQQMYLRYVSADLRAAFKCDLYAFPEYRPGHPLYDHGQWRRAYWLNKFGHSRKEEPKGLAVVSIPYVVVP